ncbi:hypothetical protein P152DRAFT_405405 [Eremomyces bilateralis CBS 781.70]|uniref:White collar 1 protein n=1 Tax=Eremomyces bilateralis CBS 781.70 TaxID=1392243 RepID=A0A6G1FRV6_9PEZI|nr:uncharacterized protein P152DRAFT_405405 [Eremomyces bilateralis CBS 781.70]KAF1808513.1 hypothetical protein P152DRAFT_405405 [Eremomyces bilateralis CBS 781.70]
MNASGYFRQNYSTGGLRHLHEQSGGDDSGVTGSLLGGVAAGAVPLSTDMPAGQSLDEIVSQNAKEMRRKSVPMHYGATRGGLDADIRRVSMMEFSGQLNGGSLDHFQFDPASVPNIDSITTSGEPVTTGPDSGTGVEPSDATNMSVNTQFRGLESDFAPLVTTGSAYESSVDPDGNLDVDMNSPFDPSMSMDFGDPSLMSMVGTDVNMFGSNQFESSMMGSQMEQSFGGGFQTTSQNPLLLPGQEAPMSQSQEAHGSSLAPPQHIVNSQMLTINEQRETGQTSLPNSTATVHPTESPERASTDTTNAAESNRFLWPVPPGGFPSTMHGRPHMESQFKNIYSPSGFDMVGVLTRVATRLNPEINIGSVDLSCAFVVCDATADDHPIVYCSENFERLTGYTKHMILGRNCRFLQSPEGRVEAGVKRKYVDDDAVLYLKNMLSMRREAQISLINYRRGGQPFMNLLTMIPISWETPEIKFFVGFQVDLVETPNSLTSKNPDGSYTINYQRGVTLPRYTLQSPAQPQPPELGQTVTRDDVSTVLTTIGTGESELSRRIWDKVLLENTDDVVHVLSLKGLFLYLSPACQRVLEYEPRELVGTALSSVCHPSDIVPVTRDLKDTAGGAAVNVVFRIRRKHKGYMWFESHGALHTEQGKGRKCIILVGRERQVYTVSKNEILASGGIGDNELWSKMSTAGMFLFVSSNVRQLLDRQPDDLIGSSIQALMRPDSKAEFGRILENARTGKRGSVKHEMMNKRGQVLQAYTTIYPGDAMEGQKSTFIIAQTRFIKFSRGNQSLQAGLTKDSSVSNPSTVHSNVSDSTTVKGTQTSLSSIPGGAFATSSDALITFAGQHALAIGRQDAKLASAENLFDELKTTRSSSWQYELRQMEKQNRVLAEEVQGLQAAKKKRKRRKGAGEMQKDCANCHTKVTPEWRRGPSGNRDLCNSCGLRWAKQVRPSYHPLSNHGDM